MVQERQQDGVSVSSATGAGEHRPVAVPELIFCANGNKRFAEIAIDAGFTYGAQMPGKVYFKPEFIDLDPKRPPDQWTYVSKLRRFRPRMATVHDWHDGRSFTEIMLRAEEITEYVTESVIIIPKVPGTIPEIPRTINGRRVILGFSVPTRHGRTDVDIAEFSGWPIHLLGGSPQKQMKLWRKFNRIAEVVSIDGNQHHLMATRFCQFWAPGTADYARNRFWPALREANGGELWKGGGVDADAPYEAFARSCKNIMEAWQTGIANG